MSDMNRIFTQNLGVFHLYDIHSDRTTWALSHVIFWITNLLIFRKLEAGNYGKTEKAFFEKFFANLKLF